MYARYARLSKQGAISGDAYENQRIAYDNAREGFGVARAALAVAQSNENDTTVRAPFTGVVTDKAAQPGEIVAPSAAGGGFTRTGIATIVDMDSLEVQVDVSENFIDRVHPDQPATIKLNAYPDWDIPASVIAVIPTADESKGTVTVRVAIHAKDSRILPQMGARVSFLTGGGPTLVKLRGVTVPADAVAGSGSKRSVFVIQDNGTVQERPVQVGSGGGQNLTILSGLAPGERIAASDLDKLHDGAKVQVQE
jgi:RND family efflux transporter MFP subunit